MKITNVKMSIPPGALAKQLTDAWQMVRTYPTGQKDQKDIILTNTLDPRQVQAKITSFKMDLLVDKFTALYIPVSPGHDLDITFTVEF